MFDIMFSSSFFFWINKNDKLATHMHTYKARLNPPLSSSSKYNWKEKCQHTYLLQLHNISSTWFISWTACITLKKMYPCCGSFFKHNFQWFYQLIYSFSFRFLTAERWNFKRYQILVIESKAEVERLICQYMPPEELQTI